MSSSGLLQTVIIDVTPVLADDGLRDCISLGLIFPEAVCSVWHWRFGAPLGRQTDRQGGWERLVCRLVWTARLRYQVAVGWCWGWRTVLHCQEGCSSAAVPQTMDKTPWNYVLHSGSGCNSTTSYFIVNSVSLSMHYKTLKQSECNLCKTCRENIYILISDIVKGELNND